MKKIFFDVVSIKLGLKELSSIICNGNRFYVYRYFIYFEHIYDIIFYTYIQSSIFGLLLKKSDRIKLEETLSNWIVLFLICKFQILIWNILYISVSFLSYSLGIIFNQFLSVRMQYGCGADADNF